MLGPNSQKTLHAFDTVQRTQLRDLQAMVNLLAYEVVDLCIHNESMLATLSIIAYIQASADICFQKQLRQAEDPYSTQKTCSAWLLLQMRKVQQREMKL